MQGREQALEHSEGGGGNWQELPRDSSKKDHVLETGKECSQGQQDEEDLSLFFPSPMSIVLFEVI